MSAPFKIGVIGDAYGAQLQHFIDCLNSDQCASVGAADALATCEIGVAATRAYKTGPPITLSEFRLSS